ncbi:GlsB/YeaQ/YmgE family stress response membrane protein [Pacificimonas flava]|uniref:GlsB/YeaQ/YmgE family stress response membrane protein n=2 Tax=Pacificimonas TaxID=1960290 RepID=A0A219B8R1_9SPHN|nr:MULTISPECIES: GlsB/YeaQ/YmgE family stress response membrane protein [Pacificimonas]MBZ6377061.1 GlsB/YeaQ/YmgE family stress response membrane protein [Pacificimonas aurantium]OWV34671.1 GlsB/YeaQ/YmgE family stress response membrane protein [Pacificimonas flava]
MGWLAWIVVGLIAGILAKWIMPGRDPGGFIVTILIGIAGGIVGGWIGASIFGVGMADFGLQSIIVATLGAILLLFLYRLIRGRRV